MWFLVFWKDDSIDIWIDYHLAWYGLIGERLVRRKTIVRAPIRCLDLRYRMNREGTGKRSKKACSRGVGDILGAPFPKHRRIGVKFGSDFCTGGFKIVARRE